MIRRTAYLDEATAAAVDAAKPGFLSQSSWLALLVTYGLERQRELVRGGQRAAVE